MIYNYEGVSCVTIICTSFLCWNFWIWAWTFVSYKEWSWHACSGWSWEGSCYTRKDWDKVITFHIDSMELVWLARSLESLLNHTHMVTLAQKQHYGIQFNWRHRHEGSGLVQLRTAESYNSTTWIQVFNRRPLQLTTSRWRPGLSSTIGSSFSVKQTKVSECHFALTPVMRKRTWRLDCGKSASR